VAALAVARDCDVRTLRRHLARLVRPSVGNLGRATTASRQGWQETGSR